MDPVSAVVSGLSLSVMIAVSIVLFINTDNAKKNLDDTVRDVVDQINDSQYYAYKFDKKQEDNIRNLDRNVQIVNRKTEENRSIMNSEIKRVENKSLAKDDLVKKGIPTAKVDVLKLGNEYSLSGVGDSLSKNKPDGWLRILDSSGKNYNGGLATSKLWVRDSSRLNGQVNTPDGINIKGGDSVLNPHNYMTKFPASNGKNYVRGDTEIWGNTTNLGDMDVQKNLNVGGRIYFSDSTMNSSPSASNSMDPYYLEKKVNKKNNSSLRLTLQDETDESFQIWGGGMKSGKAKHAFFTDGTSWHEGLLNAQNISGREYIATKDWSNWMRNTGDAHVSKSLGVGISPDKAKDYRFIVDGKQGSGSAWQSLFKNDKSEVYVAHDGGYGVGINTNASGKEFALGVYSANGQLLHVGNNGDIYLGRPDGLGSVATNTSLQVQRHIDSKQDWATSGDKALFAGWFGRKVVLGNNAQNAMTYAKSSVPDTDVVVSTNPTYIHNTLKVARDKNDKLPTTMTSGIHTTNVYANNSIAVGTGGAVSTLIDDRQICLGTTCITAAELAKLKTLAK